MLRIGSLVVETVLHPASLDEAGTQPVEEDAYITCFDYHSYQCRGLLVCGYSTGMLSFHEVCDGANNLEGLDTHLLQRLAPKELDEASATALK